MLTLMSMPSNNNITNIHTMEKREKNETSKTIHFLIVPIRSNGSKCN